MATLGLRSCVARQEPYIPGALSILQGTVPGQVRGSGHMVPTYFRRELRDRVLQRPSRLRTFLFFVRIFPPSSCPGEATKLCFAPMSRVSTSLASEKVSRGWPGQAGTSPAMTGAMSNPSQKSDLRAAALAARDALSSDDRAAAAQAIAVRGLPIEIKRGVVIAGYSPIRSEIDPAPLMRKLASQGARLALPVITARGQCLRFRVWSPDDRLLRGPLGILEPSPARAEINPDIVLVPVAAFDKAGHRIGYGAGHYDRTLAQLRKSRSITAIGLAFGAQQVDVVPALQHDVALDYVLTDTEVFDFRSP